MPFVNVIQSTQYIHVIATCDMCFSVFAHKMMHKWLIFLKNSLVINKKELTLQRETKITTVLEVLI